MARNERSAADDGAARGRRPGRARTWLTVLVALATALAGAGAILTRRNRDGRARWAGATTPTPATHRDAPVGSEDIAREPAAGPAPHPEPVVEPAATAPQPIGSVRPAAAAPPQHDAETSATEGDDDLTVIDGIGPKIAAALRESGVRTFDALAAQTPDGLRAILAAHGMRLAPTLGTWPAQAAARLH